MNANQQVYEVPLVELLERVPKDARFWVEEKHSSTHYPVGRLSHEAAEMLRQQQAEIEALEQSKDRLIKTLLDVREQQPVAWGMTWKDGEIYDVISPAQHDKEEGDYNIPLYTRPVKELTDEEIEEVIGRHWNKEYGNRNMLTLCRAVLRNAQEKCNGFCGEYECKENKAGCNRKAQKR